ENGAGAEPDEDDKIRSFDAGAGGGRAAVAADDADGEGVVLGDAALAADSGGHRSAQALRQELQLALGAGDDDAAAADEQRARRRPQMRCGRLYHGLVRCNAARGAAAQAWFGPDFMFIDGILLHVIGQAEVDSAWPPAGHFSEGLADSARDG